MGWLYDPLEVYMDLVDLLHIKTSDLAPAFIHAFVSAQAAKMGGVVKNDSVDYWFGYDTKLDKIVFQYSFIVTGIPDKLKNVKVEEKYYQHEGEPLAKCLARAFGNMSTVINGE